MRYKFYVLIILILVISSCSQKSVSTNDSYDGIELPDGSIVLLNHNSSIEYDKNFETRNVILDREAYFNVVSADIPFIVTTDLGEIKVLGTKFNVNSNKDDLEVEVETGEVELKTEKEKRKLSRGQRAKYNKGNNKVEIGKAKLEFKIWLKELDVEFKKLGKEIKKESNKLGKEIKKESKKLDKKLKDLK